MNPVKILAIQFFPVKQMACLRKRNSTEIKNSDVQQGKKEEHLQ